MYAISNRDRDELIVMLTEFHREGNASKDGMRLFNLRRRALLLARSLEKKKPIDN
ncbi:MAG: hypothetical protein IKX67_07335 [Bacteroidales bacterium]|nr:hypothetical protein [Bacteroidales bacterium]